MKKRARKKTKKKSHSEWEAEMGQAKEQLETARAAVSKRCVKTVKAFVAAYDRVLKLRRSVPRRKNKSK